MRTHTKSFEEYLIRHVFFPYGQIKINANASCEYEFMCWPQTRSSETSTLTGYLYQVFSAGESNRIKA